MQKVWNVKKYDEEYINQICKKYNISRLLAKLLVSRDIELNNIDMFLNGTIDDLSDPFEIKDMDKFVQRVDLAIKNHEKVAIFGDYDVDGITSITVLYKFLSELGLEVLYYLPDRLVDGYGLNKDAITNMHQNGVTLAITVDCGITAIDEVEYAKSLGIDICITDHHECGEIMPNAYCIVDAKRKDDTSKFKLYAGVGIAFKCISALAVKHNLQRESYLKYLDIVALGTISDIVSLTDENRVISKYGIELMKNTQNEGLKALLKSVGNTNIDSIMVAYILAPRINACGRMGNATVAVKLFLEEDPYKAFKYAKKLEEYNIQRQKIEKGIFDQVIEKIESSDIKNKSSIVLWNKQWHSGVIGIVASRLVNIYSKPVILFSQENGVLKGSGRCQAGFNLYDALTKCKKNIIQFGGHELAAGLTISTEKIEDFKNDFESIVSGITDKNIIQTVDIDDEITKNDLNAQTLKDILIMKPYGQGNKVPLFLYKNLKVQAIRTIKDNKHLKFVLSDDNSLIEAIAFSKGNRRDELNLGDKIDVLCQIDLNIYTKPRKVQLIVQDFKKCVD